ncbi:hypothetical protein C7441_108191 [Pseudaminobacter salicylatoxidans]|uniref:Uncharacterized protein n=1 Tax=Pseudaminobacter salicylatoxidans TaxID=93369 RepID=A0A316C704_PSESE|nr:hypothetical protein [Pseudaminobacter salicylatoxidans]PWJ83797.1 hypothetical protein C7441_108191 [Pseudaminobacter salicylatoxidans]
MRDLFLRSGIYSPVDLAVLDTALKIAVRELSATEKAEIEDIALQLLAAYEAGFRSPGALVRAVIRQRRQARPEAMGHPDPRIRPPRPH